MSKYIIKNCPAIIEYKNMYLCAELNNLDDLKQFCADCTDCVMKQIVELCRKAPILDADWVLNKIDIQEVE